MPTASEFSKLVTSKGEPSKSASGYAITLAGELYAGKPLDAWEGNQWSDRGKELEDRALAYYEMMNGVAVDVVGFVTDDDKTMGCSPDGIVGEDGGIEIKCLKAERHTEAILYYQKHGHCQTSYVQQTQGQMMICGWKWCDLVFYHPELPTFTIRQAPNHSVVEGLIRSIPLVCEERDMVLGSIRKMENGT